jgi:hypothetical protein
LPQILLNLCYCINKILPFVNFLSSHHLISNTSSPDIPIRMLLPNSPHPTFFHFHASHQFISPFNSPALNIHVVADTDHCSVPPLSPAPSNFSLGPIPSPIIDPDTIELASANQREDVVSSLLSGLQFENLDRSQTILAHS